MPNLPLTRLHTLAISTILLTAPFWTPLCASAQKLTSDTVSVGTLRVPEKAREHLARAVEAAKNHDERKFEAETALALAIDPNFAEAYMLRATHAADLHNYDQSLDFALEAQRIDPFVPWATLMRVSDCNAMHRFAEAQTLLEKLSPAESMSWMANYERARTAIGLVQTGDALRWTARTLQTAPESFIDNAHLLRANALQLVHRFPEAIEHLQAYLNSPRPQPLRARVLEVLQNTQAKVAGKTAPTEVAELGTK